MGYVYAGQGAESKHFKFGRTTRELSKRNATHRTSHPGFAIYRFLQTANLRAAERFLKTREAEKRVPKTKEWFALTREEVNEAFSALEVYLQTHISATQEKEVKTLAKQKSNGKLLPPDENDLAIYERLRKIKIERQRLDLEDRDLKDQLKLQIGCHDGIDGLFSWASGIRNILDQKLVKEKYPEVWDACNKENIVRTFLLVDEGEEEEPEEE